MSKIETHQWEEALRLRHPTDAERSPALLKTAARLIAVATSQRQTSTKPKPKTWKERIHRAFQILMRGE